jgi:multisubunit Na+/H+ antiporter MnhC subunit
MADPKIADELKQMEHEPLLPVEKKLILWSIVIGIALSGFLLWMGHKLILR